MFQHCKKRSPEKGLLYLGRMSCGFTCKNVKDRTYTSIHVYLHTNKKTNKHTDKQTDPQTDTQQASQPNRQTGRQADRQEAKPLIFEGFPRGCNVVLRGRHGILTCSIKCRKSFCVTGAIFLRRFQKMSCTFRGTHSTLVASAALQMSCVACLFREVVTTCKSRGRRGTS